MMISLNEAGSIDQRSRLLPLSSPIEMWLVDHHMIDVFMALNTSSLLQIMIFTDIYMRDTRIHPGLALEVNWFMCKTDIHTRQSSPVAI